MREFDPARLQKINEASSDAHVAFLRRREAILDLRQRRDLLAAHIAPRGEMARKGDPDAPARQIEKDHLATLNGEIQRAEESLRGYERNVRITGALRDSVAGFIQKSNLRPAKDVMEGYPRPTIRNLEGVRSEIDKTRAAIQVLKAKLVEVDEKPIPQSEALERVRAFATSKNEFADIQAADLASHNGTFSIHSFANGRVDLMAVISGSVIEFFTERLEALYRKTGPGITHQERQESTAKINSELAALEIREESLIRTAEDLGYPIERRVEADPAALIGPFREGADGDLDQLPRRGEPVTGMGLPL